MIPVTRLLLLLALLSAHVGPLRAAPSEDNYKLSTLKVRKEIVGLISLQMAAFRSGDLERAYSYSANRFRAQFPLERFVAVVKASYPEVWDNVRAQFGVVRDDGASAIVTVEVTDKAGDTVNYDYFLLHEDTFWHIGGVIRHDPVKAPQA